MQIIKKIIAFNFNKSGNTKQYIVVHDTGDASMSSNAEAHYNFFNSGNKGISLHYVIDDTQVIQLVEDDDRSWHAGVKYGTASRQEVNNSNSIGIGICVNNDGDYQAAYGNTVNLVKYLMHKYNITLNNVVTHYEACAKWCPASMSVDNWQLWEQFKKDLLCNETGIYVQAAAFVDLSENSAAEKILELVKPNALEAGLFPSVKAAQMILESNFLKSELAQKANNCFGMKKLLSGNAWASGAWDGVSVYTKETQEQETDGTVYITAADFRKYACVEDSITDHSAYLLKAKSGNNLRYAGITEAADYKEQIKIIKEGGYATDTAYITKVCSVIERYGLDKYDKNKKNAVDTTVSNALADGVISDKVYWTGVLNGNIIVNPEYLKILLDRYHEKIK